MPQHTPYQHELTPEYVIALLLAIYGPDPAPPDARKVLVAGAAVLEQIQEGQLGDLRGQVVGAMQKALESFQ